MNATECFALTLKSSWETLEICARQSRKDAFKVARFVRFISPIAWRWFLILCLAFYWLGTATRDLWDEFVRPNIDSFVESCLEGKTAMNKEYADQLLKQSEANEIWAVIAKPKAAAKLRKTAKKMTEEAIAILDELGEGYKPDAQAANLSDAELLKELGVF